MHGLQDLAETLHLNMAGLEIQEDTRCNIWRPAIKFYRSLLHVCYVVDHGGFGVVQGDGNDLPVQLAIVNHSVHAQGFDL